MIDILILYVLLRREFTMYAIAKEISTRFAPYTIPSFGAIKPALRRLEEEEFLTSSKVMSEGGRPSIYYSLTPKGRRGLAELILEPLTENPLQFIPNAKIRLSMADILTSEERIQLFLHLKTLALTFKRAAEGVLENEYVQTNFYQRILLDNTAVEYNNLLNVIEGFEKDNARNSK